LRPSPQFIFQAKRKLFPWLYWNPRSTTPCNIHHFPIKSFPGRTQRRTQGQGKVPQPCLSDGPQSSSFFLLSIPGLCLTSVSRTSSQVGLRRRPSNKNCGGNLYLELQCWHDPNLARSDTMWRSWSYSHPCHFRREWFPIAAVLFCSITICFSYLSAIRILLISTWKGYMACFPLAILRNTRSCAP
jgi:hypothetical protein